MSYIENLLYIRDLLPGYAKHWTYFEHGVPVMIIARYGTGKDKTYRQFRKKKEEWIEGTCSKPYPLFGLNSLINSSPFNALLITEGEKCASVLHQFRWPVISTALGSKSPPLSDWNPIRHYKRFIIFRDNDKAGILFARTVTIEIKRIVPDAEIFMINLVKTIPGGDLVDWAQSTVLRGQNWDGYESIPENMLEPLKNALYLEVESSMLSIEECSEIDFKPIEVLFEGLPRKFQLDLKSVPTFPLDSLPKEISEYLATLSSEYSQVPDYAATSLIAALGGLIGRSIHLKMSSNGSWVETSNCWCVLIGPPSAKKSPIMRDIFKLFKPLEKRAAEKFQKEEREYNSKKKNPDLEEGVDFFPPIRQRYITDDSTTPKLRELMAGNPRGIIYRCDELKGQFQKLDKIGNEGDRSFMMSCWSGLEDYSDDRMCRTSQLNIPLALTWVGCIPPSPLHKYLREAMSKGSGADGFMQRFQFVCYPDSNPKFKLPEKGVCSSLQDMMQNLFQQLDNDAKTNRTLYFSVNAQNHFNTWLINNENDARSGSHPGYWESHIGKQAKVIAVLSIIIHRLKEIQENTQSEEVSLETLQSAMQIQSYYLSHAKRCYESVSGGAVSDAEIILE